MAGPEQYFHSGFCASSSPQLTPEKRHSSAASLDNNKEQHFAVEDLLDFSKDDIGMVGDVASGFDSATDSSTVTVVDSCNSASFSGCDPGLAAPAAAGGGGGDMCHAGFADNDHFSSELCVPYDDLAELEWLSNFVEESFSSEDLQKMQLISGIKARPDEGSETTREFPPEPVAARTHHHTTTINSPIFQTHVSVPAKARSKRSRIAPCNWASRLLVLTEPEEESSPAEPVGPAPSLHLTQGKKTPRAGPKKKPVGPDGDSAGEARRCLHCATDKTPQWRTGPMGPKTLCNACGVRYKSGRLVPEYRPAASPTFVLTKHSNSHRKVLELRRQKEVHRAQQMHQQPPFGLQGQNMVFDMANNDDYLIHQHVGPDFRQLI